MIDVYKNKINNSIINTEPYPHFTIDNFLEEEKIKEIKKFWPNEYLHDDQRGSNCFYFSSELKNIKKNDKDFWKNFINNDIFTIANLLFSKFFTSFKYKKISNKIEWGTAYSQENKNKSKPLDFFPHTHFDHDPLWVLTFLIYIDDLNSNSPGTSICSIGEDKKERVENFLKWNEIANNDDIDYSKKIELSKNLNIKNIKTIEFKPNRLFCFVDGPFSFHSVNYINTKKETNRKSLRFALGFERNKMAELYNVEPDNWIPIFKNNQKQEIKNILDKEHDKFFSNDNKKENNEWYIDNFPFF